MRNLGTFDRILRLVLGLALLALFLLPAGQQWLLPYGAWRFAVPVVAAVLILTAVVRFCPAYALFGVRTCRIPTRGDA